MKRIFALLAALCLFTGCLAGCSAKVEDDEIEESRAAVKEEKDNSIAQPEGQQKPVETQPQLKPAEPNGQEATVPMEPIPGDPKPDDIAGNFRVPDGGYDGSYVIVRFAHTMGSNLSSVLDYYIAEFNKLYPNIRIEHTSYGSWSSISDQIRSEILEGNQPNIAYCYPDHVANYKDPYLAAVTLDELIKSQETVTRADGSTEILGLTQAQILDLKAGGFYNEGMVYGDNLMYTLPLSKSTEVLYYNKTFFEANGLSVPTTWEEMEAVCSVIKQLDSMSIPLGYDSEDNLFINLCEQYGYDYTSATGEHFLFNNDGCKSFVKMLNRWYQKGYITTESLYGAYTSGLFTEPDKANSHSYMSIGSTGGARYNIPQNGAFEVGVAPIPQANPGNPKVISQGPSLCLLSGTNQEIIASWLFMKYLATNPEFQAEFSMTSGYMPVIASAQNHPAYRTWISTADGYSNIAARVIQVCNAEPDAYFIAPAFKSSSKAREVVGYLLAECMLEENLDSTIDALFQNAYDNLKYFDS